MSDKPEGGSLKDKLTSPFLTKKEKKEKEAKERADKMVEPKAMSLEEVDKKLEEVKSGMQLAEPKAPVESGEALAAKNPNMARKHHSIMSQKPAGARKYFRSK